MESHRHTNTHITEAGTASHQLDGKSILFLKFSHITRRISFSHRRRVSWYNCEMQHRPLYLGRLFKKSPCVPSGAAPEAWQGVKCGTPVAPGLETEVALSKTRTLSEPVPSGKSYSACLLGELWGPRREVCENALYTTKYSLVHKCSYH